MRDLLRDYADRGATVLLYSHLLHEIEAVADDLVVIGNGRIVAHAAAHDRETPTGRQRRRTYIRARRTYRSQTAVFDRAEARDFADIFVLARRYDIGLMLERAIQLDAGFDKHILATMLGSLERFDDSEIPVPAHSVTELRRFFHSWRLQLLTEPVGDG